MTVDSIPQSEFAARRARVLRAMKGAVGLVFAGPGDPHGLSPRWRPHAHFEYLTGITDEPEAALLLDPTHPVADRREMLFLRPLNPEVEKWDGYRDEITSTLREKTGIKAIFRLDKLALWLRDAARRSRKLACLHPLAMHTHPVSPDLDLFRRVCERIPATALEDHSDLLAQMRAAKSRNELAMIERAIDITAAGFDAVLTSLRPGLNEFDVQETLEHTYRTRGSRTPAFGTIAGGGLNSTVLHYHGNDQPLKEGDLICIDSGASWAGYAADVTRTLPVSGHFSKRQREVYDVVLEAQRAAIDAVRPGATIPDIDKAARDIIEKAGYGDHFIHGIGHHLGLETHDITPIAEDGALREGAVITIEPGVYIPQESIGVRIEDDVLVTRSGAKVLSEVILKAAGDIEAAMAGALKRKRK